ncbi:MAG: phosphate-starvation-inducible PsiE family protein [Nitrospirae bacterium]|nr:phosphate-starvation-inducible PsiE family protein [Nitrospirota bacterium]
MSWQPLESVRLFDGDVVWQRLSKLDLMELWSWSIKGVLSLVIVMLLTALTGGTLKTFWHIRLLVDHSAEVILRQIIVNTLILLAIVEVFKTTVTYFREGRVKVTFIVDTILVVMLTEVISQWFKGGDWQALTVLCGIVLVLGIVRVMAVRWSPAFRTEPHDSVPHDLPNQGGFR